MTQKNTSLLPNGLKDLLPPEAEKESHIINLLMQEFSKFGYDRVKPPLVEFEESLLAPGPGQALATNTFRLMDPVSQKMMGLRADTTAQIARIAKSRLSDVPRPLRLSYAADVLKVNGTQLRSERQFCQVGCEMIGIEQPQDDVEICLTALCALQKIGVTGLSIDLTIPALIDDLFEAYGVDEDTREDLTKLLQKRDRDGLDAMSTNMSGDIAKCFVGLLDASGVASDAVALLDTLDIPETGKLKAAILKDVYHSLSETLSLYGLDDINITIDMIERRGFDYQNGISFTLFSSHVQGELGRGGRYQVVDGRDQNASGFTLYMDSVLQATDLHPKTNKKYVDSNMSWDEIKKLQDAGYQVSRKTKK